LKRLLIGPEVVHWVEQRVRGTFDGARGIGLADGDALCAGVIYEDWNGVNIVCHIAAEGRRWATRWYLGVIFDYPFVQIGAKRITVAVGEGNRDSRRFVEHLGFTREANLTGAHPTGDLIIYRMWKTDCRFLREPYALTRPDLLRAAA